MFENSTKTACQNMGLQFEGLCLLPFLCTGMTYETFHWFGTEDVASEQLKINEIGRISE